MGRVYKADIRRETTCPACETGYYYFDEIEVREGGGDFEAAIRKTIEHGVDVVPCPSCKQLSGAMRKQHWTNLATYSGGLLVCLAVAWGLLAMFGSSGVVMIGLLVLVALGALGCGLAILFWPFAPWANRDRAVIPGQEDQASDAVKAKIAAWQAGRDDVAQG